MSRAERLLFEPLTSFRAETMGIGYQLKVICRALHFTFFYTESKKRYDFVERPDWDKVRPVLSTSQAPLPFSVR